MDKVLSIPVGVKVIAVLYYIGAALGIIFGFLFLAGARAIGSILSGIPLLGAFGAGLFAVGGILLIGLGILSIFIGRGLWKAKTWARIVAIIFAAVGILMAVGSIILGNIAMGIFDLAIELVIGGYLLFSNDVKEAFA